MTTTARPVPIGLTREDLVYYVCEAIEGSPAWAASDPHMNALFDALLTTGDVGQTLKAYIPDAEWKEAARLILTRAPHHEAYTPPGKASNKPADKPSTPVLEHPTVEPLEHPDCPDDEHCPDGADECYVVIIHDEDWTVAELTAVPAKAARFARRMARKEWLAAGNSDDGIEFNARAAGPEA